MNKARIFIFNLASPLIFLSLLACTEVKPEISIISGSSFAKLSSPSPFDKDNYGGQVIFQGACLPQVDHFEFELDNLGRVKLQNFPRWDASFTYLDSLGSVPTPNRASAEYDYNHLAYDADCSDKKFTIFLYNSTINQLYLDQTGHALPDPFNPRTLKIYPVMKDSIDNPITMQASDPVKMLLSRSDIDYGGPGLLVSSTSGRNFRLNFLSASGTRASLPVDTTLQLQLVNPSTGAIVSNSIFMNDNCSTSLASGVVNLNAGSDNLSFCVKTALDSGLIAGNYSLKITPTVGATSLQAFNQDINVKSATDAYASFDVGRELIIASSGSTYPIVAAFRAYSGTPKNLSRFELTTDLSTTLNIISAPGSILADSVQGCNRTTPGFSLNCTTPSPPSSIAKFSIKDIPNSGKQVLNLKLNSGLTAEPIDFASKSIRLVNDDGSYLRPGMIFQDGPAVRLNSCNSIILYRSTLNGGQLFNPTDVALTIEAKDSSGNSFGNFFANQTDCTANTGGANSKDITLSGSSYAIMIFYRANFSLATFPADGKVIFGINDTTNSKSASYFGSLK